MVVYACLVAFVLLGIVYLNLRGYLATSKSSQYWLFAVCSIIVLLAALRAPTVGPDTPGYIKHYYEMSDYSFDEVFKSENLNSYCVYYILSKVFNLLNLSFSVWFGVLELFYIIPIYVIIKKYSSNYLFSILLFITSGLFAFSLTGLKQTLAMAFMLMAFISMVDKKYILTIIMILLGYYSHPSSGIFLGGFALYLFRNTKYFIYLILAITAIVIFEGELLFANLIELNGDEHFESYLEDTEEAYTATTLVYYSVLLGISILGYRNYAQTKNAQAKFMLGMGFISCALQSLAAVSPNAFRLAYFFTPFYMILIPNTINSIQTPISRQWVFLITLVIVCFYFLYTTRATQFDFIWNSTTLTY